MMKDTLHLRAPGNWINDPNGFIYYKGNYHLFYQYFPYAPRWGTMHWGHAVSKDLIHWEHKGIALFPTKEYDRNGIFSGSALEVDGKLYLYYSAIQYLETDPEDVHNTIEDRYLTSQAMLISEDGEHFDNWNAKRQIIPIITDCGCGDAKDTRDPKVWKEGDNYYLILGSTHYREQGRVLFYQSKDALNWRYQGQCQTEYMGNIMECPDLFRVGGQYVFIGSPMNILNDGLEYSAHAVCTLADFTKDNCTLHLSDECQYMDYGLDFYAPQSNVDEAGRRTVIGWMRMPKPVKREEDTRGAWNGMMSLPRLVEIRDGHICFPMHPSVNDFFDRQVEEKEALAAFQERKTIRMKTTIRNGEQLDIGGYRISLKDGILKTDRSRVFIEDEKYRMQAQLPKAFDACRLDILVDTDIIEIFVNEGEYVISHIVYELGDDWDGRIEEFFLSDEV